MPLIKLSLKLIKLKMQNIGLMYLEILNLLVTKL